MKKINLLIFTILVFSQVSLLLHAMSEEQRFEQLQELGKCSYSDKAGRDAYHMAFDEAFPEWNKTQAGQPDEANEESQEGTYLAGNGENS
jgi:hypothetical protein